MFQMFRVGDTVASTGTPFQVRNKVSGMQGERPQLRVLLLLWVLLRLASVRRAATCGVSRLG